MTEDDLPEVTFHIYPTDCDMLGHLNHATMLNFLERARWALLEPQIDIRNWAKQPVFSVVRHVDIGYLAQSLPGEDLVIRSGLLAIKRTSYIIRQDVRKVGSNVLVAEASIVFVAVNQQGEPVPVPDPWRQLLPPWPEPSDRARRRHARSRSTTSARGYPVVFLHAFPLNRTMWDPQVERARRRVPLHPDRHARLRRLAADAAVLDGSLRRRRRRACSTRCRSSAR